MSAAATIDLDKLVLDAGAHSSIDQGVCVMELGAYVAQLPFSDEPKCTSRVIAAFLRSLNDRLETADRQELKRYVVEVDASGHVVFDDNGWPKPGPALNTNTGDEDDVTRAWMCADWLVHEYTPAMLRLAGLTEHAEALEQLVALVDQTAYQDAKPAINAARRAARELRDEKWKAAWAAEAAGAAWAAEAAWAAGAAWAAWAAQAAWAAWAAEAAWAAGAAGAAEAAWAAGAAGAARSAAENVRASGGSWTAQRQAAYAAALPIYEKIIREQHGDLRAGIRTSALQLLDRMIAVDTSEKKAA